MQPETRTGILKGTIYPHNVVGTEIEIEVVDDEWGRDHAHSLWVRLDDLTEPEPEPHWVPAPVPGITAAKGGITFGAVGGMSMPAATTAAITSSNIYTKTVSWDLSKSDYDRLMKDLGL